MVGRISLKRKFLSLLVTIVMLVALIPPSIALGGDNQWTSNGPYGQTMNSVAVSSNYATDRTVFASAGDYIFKSTDAGLNWTQIYDTFGGAGSIAVSPNYATDRTVFASASGYVFKSTDAGASWTKTNNSPGMTTSIALSPDYATDKTLFVGTLFGMLYKSTDAGASWALVQSGMSPSDYGAVTYVAVSPNYAIDKTVFTGADYYNGLYKSTDGGASWTHVDSELLRSISSITLSPTYASDATLFVGDSGSALCKSTDGGASWAKVGSNVSSIALSPNYASDATLFVGKRDGVYESSDGGASWSEMNTGLTIATNTSIRSIAIVPNYASDPTVFAGINAGIKNGAVYSYTLSNNSTAPKITLSTNPPAPNGANGWFISPTTVTLTPSEPVATYYQWDTQEGPWTPYEGSFEAPEGRHTLFYYSGDVFIDVYPYRPVAESKVIKVDYTAPSLTVPHDMTVQATSSSGATVNFAATATDNLSSPTVTYSKNPGTVFPVGDTTVTVTAKDEAGNTTTKNFNVRVQVIADATAPTAPTSLKLTLNSTLLLFTKSISLNWYGASDNVGVSSYIVQRSTDGKTWSTIDFVNAPTATYTDTSISSLSFYYYRVLAKDAAGNVSFNSSPVASTLVLIALK